MILTAAQPAYWPWPGLLAKVRDADLFVVLDTVVDSKGSFTNRNQFKTQNGVQWLTVPVTKPRARRIIDIEVCEGSWRRKHYRTLELAYSKAPHWNYYKSLIQYLVNTPGSLADIGYHTTMFLMGQLGVRTAVVRQSELGTATAGNELIIDLCQMFNADTFAFGIQGRNYYNKNLFLKAGIKPTFQSYASKRYPQLHGKFKARLSALDLLLNCGPEGVKYL